MVAIALTIRNRIAWHDHCHCDRVEQLHSSLLLFTPFLPAEGIALNVFSEVHLLVYLLSLRKSMLSSSASVCSNVKDSLQGNSY